MKEKIITFCAFLVFVSSWCFSQTCNPPTATLKVDYSQTANPDICNPTGTALCKPAGETYPNASENQVWSAKIQIPLYCPHPDDPPNSLAAAEFRVNFDKLKLQATDETGAPITQLTAGTAFPNIILNEVNNTDGFIQYAAYALSGQSSPSEVVAFYFKAIASAADTTISFVEANEANCELAIVADYPGRSIVPPQLTLTNLTVKIKDTTPPAIPTWSEPPTNAGDGQIVLSWTPNTEADMQRYRVYMKSTDCGGLCVNNPPLPPAKSEFTTALTYVSCTVSGCPQCTCLPTTYTHTGLTNDTVKYWYIITAIDASGNGDDKINRSSEIKGDIPTGIKPPATPTGLTASATYTAGNKKISVTWNKVETRSDGTSLPLTELTGYNVLRASAPLGGNCGTYTKLPTSTSPPIPPQNPQPTTYTYTDTSIFNQTKYCYKVDAQDTGGRRSNPVAEPFNIDFNDPAPPTPTGLAGVAGDRKVDLSWLAVPTTPVNPGVNDDIAGYNLYRGSGTTEPLDGNFTLVNTSAPITGTTFPNTLLINGTTYWYKITAVDTAPGTPSESARSTAIRVKIPEETPPVLQSAISSSLTRVDLLFNEKLQSSSANTIANYKICSRGQPNCDTPALTISAAALQTDRKTVRLTTSSQAASRPYTVEVRNVADQWGNPIPPTSPSTADFDGFVAGTDNVPPVVSSVQEPTGNTTVIVNFLDQTGLESVSATTKTNYTICPVESESSTTCLTPYLSITAASCISCFADPLQVSLTTSSQLNRWYRVIVINVTDSASAQNMIVNNNSTNVANFQGTYTQVTPLELLSAIAISNTRVVLTFSKEIGQAGSYTTEPEPTLTITPTKIEGNKVTLTTSSQTGGTSYTVTATGTTDKSGNVIGNQNRATFEGRPPLSWPYLQDVYSVSSTTVRVEFDRALDQQSAEVSANYEIKDLGGVLLPVSEAKIILDGENPKTSVRLVTATQKGTEYRLIVKGVKLEGQNVASPEQQRFFTGIGEIVSTEKPRVTSAIAISQTEVIVKYDRKMSASISVPGNYSISGGLSVVNAVGQSENREVKITTTTQRGVDYTLILSSNIKDEAGINSIDVTSQNIFRGKDETKPEIRHTPITTAPIGKEIPIIATVTDNTRVNWVGLYYKRKNEVSFKEEIMALVATNQYRRTIPANEVTFYDIEYYLVVYDTSGNTLKTDPPYTIKGGADKIEITRSDKNVSSITVQVGDIIYLKAKCYLGDNLVNFVGISFEEGEGFAWTDKQKKGSIMPISPQEIKYFPKEKGDEVIKVVLTVAGKGIEATLNIAIDKGIEDTVRIPPEEYNIPAGCTDCRKPAEDIEFPPMKITAIREDGNKDATKKPITSNVVFYFNHRTSSAKERGIVNREVRLYNMKGRLVKKLEVRPQDGATFLNTSDLPRGIYIYQGVEMDVSGAVIQAEKPKMIRILR